MPARQARQGTAENMQSRGSEAGSRSKSLQSEFRREFGEQHWLRNTIAAVIGLFVYALFGVVDFLVLPGDFMVLWQARYLVTMPLALAIFVFQFLPGTGKRWSGPILFLVMLVSGFSIIYMNFFMPEDHRNLYFTGLLIVLVFGHALWRAPFWWPTAASLILFVGYLWLMQRYAPLSPAQLASSVFYYVSACFMMIYAGWFFDRQEYLAFLLRRELQQAATSDSLTGIANRRAFFEHLEREWRRAQRERTPVSLLAIDLDNMKEINDTGGHPQGDEALRRVSEVLSGHARRPGDLAARVGGDEFMLLLLGSNGASTCRLASEIVQEVRQKQPLPQVTVSIGAVCLVPSVYESHERMIQLADQALYEAKQQGRSQAVCRII